MRIAVILALLVLLDHLSDVLALHRGIEDGDSALYPDVWERHTLDWNWTDKPIRMFRSRGPYTALDVQEATFEVDTSGVWETGPATSNVHLSYWFLPILNFGEKVPVIAVISPYFSMDSPVMNPVRPMLLEQDARNLSTTIMFLTATLCPSLSVRN